VIAFVVEQLTLYWIVAHRFTVGANGPVLYFLDPRWTPRVAAPVLLGVFVLALGWIACAVGQQAILPTGEAGSTMPSSSTLRTRPEALSPTGQTNG
jgi:hypothetical protein